MNLATPSNKMLSTIVEGSRPQILSRESRVSLPDEAKQYIANMTDSPVANPEAEEFVSKFGPASRVVHPQIQIPDSTGGRAPSGAIGAEDSPGGTKEFLDMRDEDDEDENEDGNEEDEEDVDSAITETDADSEILPVTSSRESLQAQEPQQSDPHKRHGNSRSDVDEFPLPPSIVHSQGQHAIAQAQLQPHGHVHGDSPSQVQHPNLEMITSTHPRHQQIYSAPPHSSTDRLENPYSPPGQYQHQPLRMDSHHQQHPPIHTVPASFRALPLLSSDLPHTTITVSHSFVRPNERGKEVLSFVVYVDPGKGKGGWKVEKMYSDVLGLDQRVRSSVAKGIGRKIASLPEGKLWKDHAPAKVDQRKVRVISFALVTPIV